MRVTRQPRSRGVTRGLAIVLAAAALPLACGPARAAAPAEPSAPPAQSAPVRSAAPSGAVEPEPDGPLKCRATPHGWVCEHAEPVPDTDPVQPTWPRPTWPSTGAPGTPGPR